MADFSENLKKARLEAGLTQIELAKMLGHNSEHTVQRWEYGAHRPSRKSMERICAVLKKPESYFFRDDPSQVDEHLVRELMFSIDRVQGELDDIKRRLRDILKS
ncbi:MAG: helix-turn-helix transcriptional regulator [Candidatus Eremiobacteraeota bacterium]|nr:helix-turn-helix transcriptional regulator [Candidatus Eremiobacteraeota bacterium]